jgi:hypothetical protein
MHKFRLPSLLTSFFLHRHLPPSPESVMAPTPRCLHAPGLTDGVLWWSSHVHCPDDCSFIGYCHTRGIYDWFNHHCRQSMNFTIPRLSPPVPIKMSSYQVLIDTFNHHCHQSMNFTIPRLSPPRPYKNEFIPSANGHQIFSHHQPAATTIHHPPRRLPPIRRHHCSRQSFKRQGPTQNCCRVSPPTPPRPHDRHCGFGLV